MKCRLFIFAALAFCISSSPVFGKLVTETVSYTHDDIKLDGYLSYDDAVEGKRPGVLVVHEWWGLNDYARQRAEQLAELGYVAFAVDMYGKGKVTEHPDKAAEWMKQVSGNIEKWRKRAMAGLEILRNHSRTAGEKIAAIGYCFGGSTVQQLAYSGTDIKGVVSFHGSLVTPPEDISSDIPARMLILHGASDPMTEKKSIPDYLTAMEKSGIDWQMVIYGGAKHSFTNPNADEVEMDALAYSKSADQRSWAHMKLFFDELFR